jgi:hypothetical protein
MTHHTTFARRRRKVAVLRQNIQTLETILTPMNALLKDWKTSLAGIVGILAIIVSTWLPEYQVQLDKAVVVLMGLGLLGARDPKPNISGPPSYLQKMLIGILMLSCLPLISCSTSATGEKTFLGITSSGWVAGGKAAVIGAAPVLLQERAKTSAKQPVKNVQP